MVNLKTTSIYNMYTSFLMHHVYGLVELQEQMA